MMSPLVTVVTPSFNQGHFIRATIESVLGQNYGNLEYIVMDGGSTDETAAVVKDYSSRLTWISERDRGQSHAINKGFRMAKGEIVSWLNSDDLLLPGAVARAAVELSARPHLGAVYGEGYQIDREGNILQRFPHTEPFNLWKLTHLSDYILQQSVFLRRTVVEEAGYLDENLHYVMDWDLWIRIGQRYEMGHIPEFLGCIREYPEAKSFCGGSRRVSEIRTVLRKHTGMRFPPGYIVYGLDTYRKIWCEAIEKRTPGVLRWPSRKLQRLVNGVCSSLIGRQIRNSQGWFSNGWTGKTLELMVPSGVSRAHLSGFNPTPNAGLKVMIDRRDPTTETLPQGDFAFTLALGSPQLAARRIRIESIGFRYGRSRCFRLDAVGFDGPPLDSMSA